VPVGTVPHVRVTVAAADPDGDAISYRHEWAVNGAAIPAASGQQRLAAPALRKHDRVRVVVTPFDGELAGPPAAAECEVANTAPTAPVAVLEPTEPTAARGMQVALRKASSDADGDPVVYRYTWSRDGVPVSIDGGSLPPAMLRHGEVWRVVVTPFDGEQEGEGVVLQATVANTPPPPPAAVTIAPSGPASGEALTCDARTPEIDADREPVALRYRWLRADRPEPIGEGSPTLPAGVVRRGERWRCEAWATDGTAESARVGAEVVVRNTPPTAPLVTIEPERPRRGDALACRIATASDDPDGDAVSYAYAWTENDRPVAPGAEPARVDPSRVAKGKRWRCTVTPSDGSGAGASSSAQAVVANRPPGAVAGRIEPAAPRQGEPLRCEIAARSDDPDGDPVRYRYAWQRNGVPQPFSETSQEVPPRLVKAGDRWRCAVTPTDGSEDGPPSATEEAVVLPPAEPPRSTVPDRPSKRAVR
jgi:hypothetical protein